MPSFTQTYIINTSPNHVWQALTDPDMLNDWGAGPASMDDAVGTEFELWGGDIWGKNVEVVENKKLVQEWYSGEWEVPSIVTFELAGDHKATTIVLTHHDFPEAEQTSLEQGWQDFYIGPMKTFLENSKR